MAGICERREVEMSVRALWLCFLLALPLAAGAGETRRQLSLPVSFETSDGFDLKGDLTSAADANAPADVKISRAFIAGAIFHADDPAWLAAALAP